MFLHIIQVQSNSPSRIHIGKIPYFVILTYKLIAMAGYKLQVGNGEDTKNSKT